MLEKLQHTDLNGTHTPMETGLSHRDLNDGERCEDFFQIRRELGALQYLATRTRIHLSFPVNLLSTRIKAPTNKDQQALKRIWRYLTTHQEDGIWFCKQKDWKDDGIETTVDSEYGANPDSRSTFGYIIRLNGNIVNFRTRKQRIVTLSSTESEYVGIVEAVKSL